MDTSRLLRTSGAVFATAAMLISSAALEGTAPSASATSRPQGRGDGTAHGTGDRSSYDASTAGTADRVRSHLGLSRVASPLAPLPLPGARGVALRRYYEQKLSWHACRTSGFECATMTAPLDYDRPGQGDDIKLAVSRKKATGSGHRLGSLMLNPGGPGGSAITYLQQYAAAGYPAAVRARYDMVAMDPRGVAGSEPVTCLTNAEMDAYTQVGQAPETDAEVDELVDAYRKFADGCANHSGRLLRHVSTVDAARDMDVLRAALGDEKLSYVGASYGTFLGATYAGLFPTRVGKLVLDGALDPSLDSARINRDQTAGFQTAFTSFAQDCLKHKDCPLAPAASPTAAGEHLGALFKQLRARPVPAARTRRLTESLATMGVISAMYDEAAWGLLRKGIGDARRGDGTVLLALSDAYYERDVHGAYSNLMYANAAVNCLDLPPAFRGPDDVREALPEFTKASPIFGPTLAWSALTCAYWSVPAIGHPHRITARGAAPILVVGTTRDPATPYQWARSLASQLSSGRLLTYDGDGHTAYTRGSACVDKAVNTYLLGSTPPPASQKCS
ncbi:alpha/beta hydrolase [Streptomyces sp. UNOC14_S4]|uniref:alpha/beta hydrolase n=1 Tax=Streptomyces sp. UNOC14_S4 TaxID=2872340 RepID=UPI001E48EF21|nr:alpha/beta hydrolase [Streptomyces sp. UNOC14_S4]MCC3768341.1 alpha/beta hydrolase [Streptomyces sp. UNOC14_S4]